MRLERLKSKYHVLRGDKYDIYFTHEMPICVVNHTNKYVYIREGWDLIKMDKYYWSITATRFKGPNLNYMDDYSFQKLLREVL